MTTAVVTGAGSGIGRELAFALTRRFGTETCLLLADIDVTGAEQTAELVAARGGGATAFQCDVRKADDVEALADCAAESLGEVDLLFNNAGVLVTGTVADLALCDYQRAIDVNLWGVIHGCRTFVPRMRARGSGRILNVASLAGFVPLPLMGPYGATKAAVISLSESLHAELKNTGVTVTVLCPSFTRTRLIENGTGGAHDHAMSRARTLVRYLGDRPTMVAACALEATLRGELYAIPNGYGKLAWRAKRLLPRMWTETLSAMQRLAL